MKTDKLNSLIWKNQAKVQQRKNIFYCLLALAAIILLGLGKF
jgi:hypothetical protein